ncbi:hypothetical protein P8452_77304 [Trifolium repens]|nr:hypothetical protein P8452_77304 [Trifolium repens]
MKQHTIEEESDIFLFSCLFHSKILLVNLSLDSSFFNRVSHDPLFLFYAGPLHPTKGFVHDPQFQKVQLWSDNADELQLLLPLSFYFFYALSFMSCL